MERLGLLGFALFVVSPSSNLWEGTKNNEVRQPALNKDWEKPAKVREASYNPSEAVQ